MTQFVTPEGRLVQGDPFTGQTKKQDGTVRDKPNFFIAVAFQKGAPGVEELRGVIFNEARQSFPQQFGQDGNPFPQFSMKIIDGDSPVLDQGGHKPCDKEGFRGHWVIRFSTTFAPECCDVNRQTLLSAASVKRGDYIRVAGSVSGNKNDQRPGVFVNPELVQKLRDGEPIAGGRTFEDAFGVQGQQPPPAQQPPAYQPPPAQQPPAYQPPPAQQPPAYQPPPAQQPAHDLLNPPQAAPVGEYIPPPPPTV